MKEEKLYSFDGINYATASQHLKDVYKQAESLAPELRKSYIDFFENMLNSHAQIRMQSDKLSRRTLPLVRLGFLILILITVLFIPFPSQFQTGMTWTILSILGGIAFSFLPGSLEYTNKIGFKATGGVAFTLLMLYHPPDVFNKKVDKQNTRNIALFVLRDDTTKIQMLNAEVSNDKLRISEFVPTVIKKYFGSGDHVLDSFTVYRKRDGFILSEEVCDDKINEGLIIAPNRLVDLFRNSNLAYQKFITLCK